MAHIKEEFVSIETCHRNADSGHWAAWARNLCWDTQEASPWGSHPGSQLTGASPSATSGPTGAGVWAGGPPVHLGRLLPSPLAGRMAGPFQVGSENKVCHMDNPGPGQGPLAGKGEEPAEPLLSLLTQGLLSLLQFTLPPRPIQVADSCSVAQSCLTLCDPMDCSTSHFPVLYHLSVCSNSCPLSMIPSSHLILSTPFPPPDICPQSFPASGSFLESALSIRLPNN